MVFIFVFFPKNEPDMATIYHNFSNLLPCAYAVRPGSNKKGTF